MSEHRLIERFIKAINDEVKMMKYKQESNHAFIEMSVNFLHMFAQKCHEGKEEGILFRALGEKKLAFRHKQMMDILTGEHQFARKLTASMSDANSRYIKGDKKALFVIIECMEHLVDMYPGHIYRENEELKDMVKAEKEFDKDFQHQKYEILVSEIEKMLMK
jgi:hemerythrin-like domain-containing protein